MLFDCLALLISLVAAYIAQLPKKKNEFQYGYSKIETITGLFNGVFLVFISYDILCESVERIFEPVKINDGGLVTISVLGLGINLIGLYLFHDHHHGHSHDCSGHDHHHSNENLSSIYLHVMADALGSVGVIISSVLIKYYNLPIADPVCSVLISVLIFASVMPLIKSSTETLLLKSPEVISGNYDTIVKQIEKIPDVQGVKQIQSWVLRGDNVHAAIVEVKVGSQVTDLYQVGEQAAHVLSKYSVREVSVIASS